MFHIKILINMLLPFQSSTIPIDEVMCSKGGYVETHQSNNDNCRSSPSLIHLKLIDLHPRNTVVDVSPMPPPVPPHAVPLASQTVRL